MISEKKQTSSDVVFVEGFCGYIEAITDPSYHQQVLFFTHPNPDMDPDSFVWQSPFIQCAGVIAMEPGKGLLEFCRRHAIPISCPLNPFQWRPGESHPPHQISLPFQEGIRKRLSQIFCQNSGFFGSGPGSPLHHPETLEQIRYRLQSDQPVLGICLGYQLLLLALGLKLCRSQPGSHGARFAILDVQQNRVHHVSMNYRYFLPMQPLPKGWEVTFTNIEQSRILGIRHRKHPQLGVQFHPEGHPGPTDLLEKIIHDFTIGYAHTDSRLRPSVPLTGRRV